MKGQRGSAGIGFFGFLTIIFVLAKVFEVGPVALWPWWLVLSPALVGVGVCLAFVALAVVVAVVAELRK